MKPKLFSIAALACIFVVTIGANLVTAKILYDDFSSENLDPAKWESEYWNSQGTLVTDFVKEVFNDELVLKIGVESGRGRNSAPFTNPETINSIEADVTVVNTILGNDPDVRAQARLEGTFYNSKVAAGTTGDVWAGIRIIANENGLEAQYAIEEATAEDWSSSNLLIDTITSGLSYNQSYTLKIEYDAGSNEFTFTIEGFAPVTITNAVNQRDTENPWKALRAGIDNAASGVNYIHVLFDNVSVNDAAYDDFSTGPLDQTKWDDMEYSRGIVDGKAHLNVQTKDERSTSSIKPKNQDTNYIEAKFLIESESDIPPGVDGFARIGGYFYNNSRGPGSGLAYDGKIGDVFVSNRIVLSDTNNFRAYCAIWASDTADPLNSNAPNIWERDFTTPITFDTAYKLSIEYTETSLIFKLNDQRIQYDIAGEQYPPSSGQERYLQSRVYADPGESGHIRVQVDDVYVEGDDSSSETGGGGGSGGGCFITTMIQ